MQSKHFISMDLGGTSLRLAVIDNNEKVSRIWYYSSDLVRQPAQFINFLKDKLKETLLIFPDISGASLGIAGLVQHDRGMILESPHFPLWHEIELQKELSGHFHFPITIENDANQAALGEAHFGGGKDWKDFILISLGTGIGGGIILNREIFRGPSGFAGEIGHMILERNGAKGVLGIRGTWETLCSQSGLRLQMNDSSSDLPEKLAHLALEKDANALKIWQNFGENLAIGIANLTHNFGTLHYLLGGGLAKAWDLFYPALLEELPKWTYKSLARRIHIKKAELGDEAGLLGAIPLLQLNS